MTETQTEPNAIEALSGNTHRLMGNGTVCNPTKLPKGRLFVIGEEYPFSIGTTNPDGTVTWKHSVGHRTVVCNRCNKVNPYGR